MISLALIVSIFTVSIILAIPFIKGFERPTFSRHPSFTFSSAAPVRLLAVNANIMTPEELEKEWSPEVKTMTLNSILHPAPCADVIVGRDVFCNNGSGDGVVIDIGYWIEA